MTLFTSPWRPHNSSMDEPAELHDDGRWRTAVWALRVGFVGLAVAIAGLIVMTTGVTPWILGIGILIWLAAAAVTLSAFLLARHELPEPRPGFWSMRFMLIRDTVHARPRRPSRPDGPPPRQPTQDVPGSHP